MDAAARSEARHCNRFEPYAEIRIRGAIITRLFLRKPSKREELLHVVDEVIRGVAPSPFAG